MVGIKTYPSLLRAVRVKWANTRLYFLTERALQREAVFGFISLLLCKRMDGPLLTHSTSLNVLEPLMQAGKFLLEFLSASLSLPSSSSIRRQITPLVCCPTLLPDRWEGGTAASVPCPCSLAAWTTHTHSASVCCKIWTSAPWAHCMALFWLSPFPFW